MLELLEQLYLHRIAHLNKYAIRQVIAQVNHDYSIPTKQEISAYVTGQLSLFPKGSGITLIQWQRDKVAFLELFTAVYESNSIKAINRPKMTKKEYYGLLMWFFNIPIGNIDSTLQAAKNRKIEQKPYLKELMDVFDNYCARGL
jgi:RteC protein